MRALSVLVTVIALAYGHPDFKACCDFVKGSQPVKMKDETKLKVYGLFKQGTLGDCDPNVDVKGSKLGKIMLDEWCKNAGKSVEDAQAQYVAIIDTLVPDWRQLARIA